MYSSLFICFYIQTFIYPTIQYVLSAHNSRSVQITREYVCKARSQKHDVELEET